MQHNNTMTRNAHAGRVDRRNVAGLTIIEVLVVVAIISIMSGIGLIYISSESFKLQSEARNLRSALMEAKSQSVRLNSNVVLSVYPDRYENSFGSVRFYKYDFDILKSDFSDVGSSGVSVTFTPLGRSTFNFHVRMRNLKGNYYSVCVNFSGRIWLMSNNPGSCSN